MPSFTPSDSVSVTMSSDGDNVDQMNTATNNASKQQQQQQQLATKASSVRFDENASNNADKKVVPDKKDPSSTAECSSSIQSRMMKNMLGGQATSLTECIMVVVAGQLLAFNSGFTNGACLSGFLVKSGRRQAVAAFTGAYTGSALLLADGHTSKFGFQVCMILSFMLGACLAGLFTPKAVQYRIEPTYGPTFFVGGIFLLTASILAAVDHNLGNDVDDFVFYLTAIAKGLQNGLSSLYSGNLIRSSHLTGTSTDIALFTGQLLRGNSTNNWKLIVLVALAVSFWTGGFVSFYATQEFTSKTLLFNASLFLTVGVMLIVFLMHAHSISFAQAIMGTWRWKKALQRLSHHHSDGLSPSLRQAGQRDRLLDLFNHVDADGSGAITPDELLEGLREAGFALTMRDIRIMVRFADRDGNGVISEPEWRALVDEIMD